MTPEDPPVRPLRPGLRAALASLLALVPSAPLSAQDGAAAEPAPSEVAPAAREPAANATEADAEDPDALVVGPGGLTLYPRWSRAFPPVAELPGGTRLDVLRRAKAWSELRVPPAGPEGWALADVRPVLADGRALNLPMAVSPTTSGLVVKGFTPRRYLGAAVDAARADAAAAALEAWLAEPVSLAAWQAFDAADPAPAPTFGAGLLALDGPAGALDDGDAAAAERARLAAERQRGRDLAAPDDARAELIGRLDDAKAGLLGRQAARADLVVALGVDGARALGEAVAARVLADTPRTTSAAWQEYVTLVGLRLADHAPGSALTRWSFTLVDDPRPNAWSTAGGFVFVTSGALAVCADEAQLAALLAHEIAHVARDHALRSLDGAKHRLMLDSARAELTASLPAASPAHQALIDELTGACDALWQTSRAPLDQAFEHEADALAVQLLQRAGYAPGAALEVLERVAREDAAGHALTSHPPAGERAARVRVLLTELDAATTGSRNTERYEARVGS